ncbi:hypothetical protein HBI25_004710 [Parastagonospora nodorum]|nr:hypothetical protein HBH74_082920 [Parastagonospora nodorum]KAH4997265.1 hypothetical protein HBH73_008140 [Parastagonospora nodorum]KAH5103784.1 hypothetical protein HBH72_074750 [Parastagonospora nodorum]KAH5280678.1 hypothetical protein HBI72_023350 [Parastagonospora nodorum]KAH5380765.1 hypothetical protein HBI49_008210 [Parastagonospora nodorum]
MVSLTGIRILAATVTVSMLATTGLADFHILGCANNENDASAYAFAKALPSDRYNCDGLGKGGNSRVVMNWDGLGQAPSYFRIVSDTCRKTYNLYKNGDKYDFFEAGGNGKALGACYPNSGPAFTCTNLVPFELVCREKFVCYGPICAY